MNTNTAAIIDTAATKSLKNSRIKFLQRIQIQFFSYRSVRLAVVALSMLLYEHIVNVTDKKFRVE